MPNKFPSERCFFFSMESQVQRVISQTRVSGKAMRHSGDYKRSVGDAPPERDSQVCERCHTKNLKPKP